jgi:hypothetical protein
VIAINIYGESQESDEGNGAVITTNPDAPVNLLEDETQRTKSTLAITWEDAPFTGGAVIIDYRVSIAEQGGSYSVLASNVAERTYLAVDLISGVIYSLKVESRNSYGYSVYSDAITLLAAFIPDPPLIVTTTNSGDQVLVKWASPNMNGSPVTSYRIFIREHNSQTYTEESVECDGTSATVVSARECYINLATLQAAPYNLVKDENVFAKISSVNVYGESA